MNREKKNILIIDDDVDIGNAVEEMLKREGYSVSRAYSGTEALLMLKAKRPDLVLLDLMLPGLNGEEVLPKIKGIPVIVVSARASVDDKVQLLLGGAVDYVTKPFHQKELLARIAVQLRDASTSPCVITFGNLVMDTEEYTVRIKDNNVKLTRTEFAILKMLLKNPKQVVTKSILLDYLSADTPDGTESSLKTHVSHLRTKLRQADGTDYIESVWGIGFKMREE